MSFILPKNLIYLRFSPQVSSSVHFPSLDILDQSLKMDFHTPTSFYPSLGLASIISKASALMVFQTLEVCLNWKGTEFFLNLYVQCVCSKHWLTVDMYSSLVKNIPLIKMYDRKVNMVDIICLTNLWKIWARTLCWHFGIRIIHGGATWWRWHRGLRKFSLCILKKPICGGGFPESVCLRYLAWCRW